VGAAVESAVAEAVGRTMLAALVGQPYRYFTPPGVDLAFGGTCPAGEQRCGSAALP
jgi:hypothetical protein